MFARARDWYVVEWRLWSSETITRHIYKVPEFGFDDLMLRAHGLKIHTRSKYSATLHHEGGEFATIIQTPFEDLGAARLFFRKQQSLLNYGTSFSKLYLWRTVAASRRRAVVLPPMQYEDRQAELLMDYPRTFARPMPLE